MLGQVLKKPLNSLVNEAVAGYLDKRSAEVESDLQRILDRIKASRRADPHFDSAIDAFVDSEARLGADWIRIHPFANGNGRTARMWANAIFMRYGLDPVVRLRPRPDGGYEAAGARAMHGDWQFTAAVFRKMLVGG